MVTRMCVMRCRWRAKKKEGRGSCVHRQLQDARTPERRTADRLPALRNAGSLAARGRRKAAHGLCRRCGDRERLLGATDYWLDQLPRCLPATARAHAAGAHGSLKYLHQGEWHGGLGLLPVGLRRSCGWTANRIPRSYPGGVVEAQQPLAHRAQPYFAGGQCAASRSRDDACRTTTGEAAVALKLSGKVVKIFGLEETF